MAKRRIYVTALVLMLIIACLSLVACKDDGDKEPDAYVVNIDTAEVFKSVALGYGAKNATYELNADLDLGEWTPIGTSVTDSFRGEFHGNNHKITYSINVDTPSERVSVADMPEVAYYGLFGVTYGVKVKDLNVVANIDVPTMAETVYVGGLIAYAYDDVTLENVKVSGHLTTTLPDIRGDVVNNDGSSTVESNAEELSEHIGGVVGMAVGKTVANGVSVEADVKVDSGYYGACLVEYVSAGGVFGTMRTYDISKSATVKHTLSNITYDGKVYALGSKMNIGGVFGTAYRAEVNNVKVGATGATFTLGAYQRINAGGVAGLMDASSLYKVGADVTSLDTSVGGIRNSKYKSYNVGGIAGYESNGSVIDVAYADAKKIIIPDGTDNYVGGVVGMAHFSNIKSAYATGELYYGSKSITEIEIKYVQGDEDRSYHIYSGGIVGKMYGKSVISDVASEFKAYQGLVGNAYDAVEMVTVTVSEGETIEGVLAEMGYAASDTTVTAVGGQKNEDGKVTQDYKLTHKCDTKAKDMYYYSSNSKCLSDGNDAARYENKCGTIADETAMNTAKQSILAEFN